MQANVRLHVGARDALEGGGGCGKQTSGGQQGAGTRAAGAGPRQRRVPLRTAAISASNRGRWAVRSSTCRFNVSISAVAACISVVVAQRGRAGGS